MAEVRVNCYKRTGVYLYRRNLNKGEDFIPVERNNTDTERE